MKKNFFKKLSFVLALAMIVSTLAPAAGVFAAEKLSLNSTARTLLLGQDDKDEYNFNINGTKSKGWKYEWTSSDEDVATVETNGVATAVGVGKADITVAITDKNGDDVDTLTAAVVVKNNIKELTEIYCQTDAKQDLNKLAVEKPYDFGRKFTTYGGLTTTTSKTKWVVNSDKASIDASGVFKATAAGKYTITAYAFQSTEKYNAWAALKDSAATLNVLDSISIDVTVVPSVVKTQQTDLDSFKVVFDTDMSKSDFATNAILYLVLNDKDIHTGAEKTVKVTYDTATGKEATFDIYAQFVPGSTYKLVSGDFVATFKAASTDVATVASIQFDDVNVSVSGAATSLLPAVKGLNADGVIIKTSADADFTSLLSFTYGGDQVKGFVSGTDCYIYTLGYQAPVTATFDNWVWDETQKKYVEVKLTDSAVATGTQLDTTLKAGSISFVIQPESNDPAISVTTTGWNTTFSVPAGDPEMNIRYRYQTNAITDNTYLYDELAGLTFKTDDPDKLLVYGNHMVPVAAGNATVLVLNADGKTVTVFTVVVTPARTFVGATADVAGVSLGNTTDPLALESRTFTITGKDSMNDVVDPTIVGVEIVNAPVAVTDKAAALLNFAVAQNDAAVDKSTLTVFGSGAAAAVPGNYTFLVTVAASSKGVTFADTKQVRLSVIVLDASVTTVVRWSAELSAASIDRKDIIYANAAVDPVISAEVYGYNAKGARVAAAPDTDYAISLQYNGAAFATNVDTATNQFTTGMASVADPTNMYVYAKGVYTIAFKALDNDPATAGTQNVFSKAANMVIGFVQFDVKDSTTSSSTIKVSSVNAADVTTVAGAVLTAFEFKIDDVVVNAGLGTFQYFTSDGQHAVAGSAGTDPVNAGSTLFIDHVTYTVNQGNPANPLTYTYSIDVKKTIAIR